ncbi:MAG: hypothetical protein DRO63_04410, partial [Candidatus Gerdarchaeota archaeon]
FLLKKRTFIFLICFNIVFSGLMSNGVSRNTSRPLNISTQLQVIGNPEQGNFIFALTAPILISPSNGYLTNDRTPTLTWGSVSGAYSYDVQVDDNSDFSSIVYSTNIQATSITIPISLSDNTYYWRVRGKELFGGLGPWSVIWHFQVDGTPPPSPALVYPTNGLITNDNTPSFDWNPSSGANFYHIVIDNSPSFSLPYVAEYSTSLTSWTSGPLGNGVFYWHVQARDAAGNWGSYSGTRSFTIDTIPPAAPALNSPSHMSVINDDSPFLDWSSVSTAVQYHLQVASSSSFSYLEFQVYTGATSYTVPHLTDGMKYWRVRARDSANNWGSWSTYRIFTVDTNPPSQPALFSPDEGLLDNNPTPLLNWSDVADSYLYQVEVADNDTFSTLVVNQTVVNSDYTTATLADGVYYWRVRARDEAGNWGSWSVIRNFTIDTTPPTIVAVTTDPTAPTDIQLVTISCNVNDLHDIDEVILHYRINNGSWINVTMPLTIGTLYEVTIGPFSYNDVIDYFITAEDSSTHPNTATADNSGAFYQFTIVSGDVTGPIISSISHAPTQPTELDTITINCEVTDDSGIFTVILFYRIDDGEWLNQTMTLDTADWYTLTIGPFEYGSIIDYYLKAIDNSPNQNVVTSDNGGLYYNFTISSSDILSPVISTIVYTPNYPTELDDINITCQVTDASGLIVVSLYFRVNNASWRMVNMTLLSVDIYSVVLPSFTVGDTIDFYITAIDNSVAQNMAKDDNGGLYYTITISQSSKTFPIVYLLPSLTVLSIIIILRKRK